MYDHLLLAGTRKEHAVNLVSVWSIQHDVLSIECLHKDKLRLVEPAKINVIEVETAALFDARAYCNLQVLGKVSQSLHVPLILLVLKYCGN